MATAKPNPHLRLVEYQAGDRVARTERAADGGWHIWLMDEARAVCLRSWAPQAMKARQMCREWVEGRRHRLEARRRPGRTVGTP